MKKLVCKPFLALIMALALVTAALAAPVSAAVSLRSAAAYDLLSVSVDLTAEGATNGKLTVNYDPDHLILVNAAGTGAGVVSVNSQTDGTVGIAWVGSDLPAGEATVAILNFMPTGTHWQSTVVTTQVTELYAGSTALTPCESELTLSNPNLCPFTDLDGHWAQPFVFTAWQNGLVSGTGNGSTYSPNQSVTRAMFVTLLYRMAGSPKAEADVPYTDLTQAWYLDAVRWAREMGITNGTNAEGTTFSPDRALTRQEMVCMLFAYAGLMGNDTSARADLSSFGDGESVAAWAQEAVRWAVADGVISGTDAGLDPMGTADRAQAAVVLVRFAGLM